MCTIGVKKIEGNIIVFKNRDIDTPVDFEIIKSEGRILYHDKIKNSCDGINKHGVVVIKASLKNKRNIKAPHAGLYVKEILRYKSAKQALEFVRKLKCSVNMIVADAKDAYVIEMTPYSQEIIKVTEPIIRTNIGIELKGEGSRNELHKKWHLNRYKRALSLLKNSQSVEDIKSLLRNKEGQPNRSILRSGKSRTVASMIFIPADKKLLFLDIDKQWKSYKEYAIN